MGGATIVKKGGFALIRIGIVDDHPMFRLGLRGSFDRQKDVKVVWDLGTTTHLLETVASSPVDVVLMDLDLGQNQDGFAATRALKRARSDVRVMVVTASLDAETVATARRAGADGYLTKDLPVADMVAAIKKLGGPGASAQSFGGNLPVRTANGDVSWLRQRGLTQREREVLAELKRGRTNREIASRLGVSVPTVNKHVQHVLQKLHVKNRAQAAASLHAEWAT
jgi:DNA-binding NarL/FixJ family response regulator